MTCNVLELFESHEMVKVCAPMVRYSKLPFRSLVRRYNCDLCFTPMILADSFIKSPLARASEFSTNSGDKPLVVQFAAKNAYEFALAAEMVASCSNGVDLNCGCPQYWAMKDGYGADLLSKPELIRDMVLQVRNRISEPYTVSVKIRIMEDLRDSVELCRTLESTGVSFITIHARTPQQRHQPISEDALRLIRESVQLPLIANGDVKNLEGANKLHKETGCQGVMAARGLLENPALFAGYTVTPLDCVKQWVAIAMHIGTSFQTFHHHLSFMLEKILPKSERIFFSSLKTNESIFMFLENYYGICHKTLVETVCDDTEGCKYENLEDIPSSTSEKRKSGEISYEDYLENSFISF